MTESELHRTMLAKVDDALQEKNSQLIMVNGQPVSSCCQAEVQRTAEYTDTHYYAVFEAGTDDSGKIVSASYAFEKTYDGMDGENVAITCTRCGREIEQEGIDWEES